MGVGEAADLGAGIHALATNSMTYGALSAPIGTLTSRGFGKTPLAANIDYGAKPKPPGNRMIALCIAAS